MKIKGYIYSIIISIALFSCSDFLNVDKDVKDRLDIEKVFTDKIYTERWLANAYSYLSKGTISEVAISDEWPFCFSDDIYNPKYKNFKEISYNEEYCQNSWKHCYQGIRQASIFILNVDMCEELTHEQRCDYKAQARFIRAYYYWKLLQKYGPIPIMPDEGQDYTLDYNSLAVSRNTYDECVEYIASEMILAAKDLPDKREMMNIGRPTKGAALAVRAKALLYAASPLMNGNNDDYASKLVDSQGKRLLDEKYDETKWAKAAAAAKDVMDLGVYSLYISYSKNYSISGYPATIPPCKDGNFSEKNWPDGYANIDPFESYRSVFNGEVAAWENPELIFTRVKNQGSFGINHMVLQQLPLFAKGINQTCMTQKQCDAYYMNDGSDCRGKDAEIEGRDGTERESGFVTEDNKSNYPELGDEKYRVGVSLQYVQREPRFYASVAYNGAVWPLLNAIEEGDKGPYQAWYYRGSGEGYSSTANWLLTGIGVMKFVRPYDTNDDNNVDGDYNSHITKKSDTAIRYADILMSYAEALNEIDGSYEISSWDGNSVYVISRNIEEIKKGVQPIRIRAGLPDYEENIYQDKELLREKIKRERQIEFMGEGQRYFDLRRWKDAPKEESMMMYGCNTFMTKDQAEYFYRPVPITDVVNSFAEKTYFWPIHRSELQKNHLLTQNPGWRSTY